MGMIFENAYTNSIIIASCQLHARKHPCTHTHIHKHIHTSSQVLLCACMHVCRHTPVYAFSDLDDYKNKTKISKI
jgi:hypothetical protein